MQSRPVFVPCAISSFFEICDRDILGKPIENPLLIGAIGGGFRIARGNTTKAEILGSQEPDAVCINGVYTPGAKTTLRTIQLTREALGFNQGVMVEHNVDAPVGCGFGTSAAGAVGACLAIQDALSFNDVSLAGRIAHVAEVQSMTGLGTVIASVAERGWVGLVTEPGAPGVGEIRMLPVRGDNYRLVAAVFGLVNKVSVLGSAEKRKNVNGWGRHALEAILDKPTVQNFLCQSRLFAERTGLASKKLLDLADYACKEGAEGATQNMIGDAVHMIVAADKVDYLVKRLAQAAPSAHILVSELYSDSPKLLAAAVT